MWVKVRSSDEFLLYDSFDAVKLRRPRLVL